MSPTIRWHRRLDRMLGLAALGLFVAVPPALAADASSGVPADVELVLLVDVSWSMDVGEQRIQRDGYVAAFRSPEVQRAILDGVNGRVAVTYVEWAGAPTQTVVVPWTVIDTKAAADAFAARLAGEGMDRARRTSIAAAIDFAVPLFDENAIEGMRRVIDVSGDGPNNQGRPVTAARDEAAARGITINGLPLMTFGAASGGAASGISGWGSIPDLDRYYSDCVIGGPGAFAIPVTDWAQFPDAVRRKLVLELAGGWPLPRGQKPPIVKTAGRGGSDCLVGEAMWERRQERWNGDR